MAVFVYPESSVGNWGDIGDLACLTPKKIYHGWNRAALTNKVMENQQFGFLKNFEYPSTCQMITACCLMDHPPPLFF